MLEPPTYVSIRISAYVDVSRLRARVGGLRCERCGLGNAIAHASAARGVASALRARRFY